MHTKTALALAGIAFGFLAVVLALSAPASADWDANKTHDETFNNYTTALNVSANQAAQMLYFMECSQNDADFIYVYMTAAMDLTFDIDLGTEANQTRFYAQMRNPDHFQTTPEQIVGIQVGQHFYFSTTTWEEGPYYLILERCVNVDGYYNVTWDATATAAADDGNNYLEQARPINAPMGVSQSVTEFTDQNDLFRLDSAASPPPYIYFQLQGVSCSLPPTFLVELYDASGVALETPVNISSGACLLNAPYAYRLPGPGTWYVRVWAAGVTQAYSFTFNTFTYTPNQPTCVDRASTTCTATDNTYLTSPVQALNFTYEPGHFYRIYLSENDTIWVNATSSQVDIIARLWNTTLSGAPNLQKGFSSHAFTTGEDVETFSYRMTSAELAQTSGWYIVEVRLNSDLPPEGRYQLRVWLNDRPIALNRTASNPVATVEDTPIVGFDLYSLFYDNDCKLGDVADCTPTVALSGATPGNFTVSLYGGHLVNVSAAADWSGTGCQAIQAFDPKNLTATAQLCFSVAPVNDPPTVCITGSTLDAAVNRTLLEDLAQTVVNILSWYCDVDDDGLLDVTWAGNTNVSITYDAQTGFGDFMPENNFNGVNDITFTACDVNASCVDFLTHFTVFAQNDAPEARGNLPGMTIVEDSAQSMNLLTIVVAGGVGGFFDIDGDTLTYKLGANPPSELDITILGSVITVRPQPNVGGGFYYFEVKASDGFLDSFPASVRVDITGVNDLPTIDARVPVASTPTVAEGASREFTVTTSDVDGDTRTYTWYLGSTGISGAVNASYTYRADLTNEGNRSVIIKVNVSDGHGGYNETSWTLTITNVNQAPTVAITAPTKPRKTVAEGDPVDFSSTCTDPDGDTLSFVWSSDRSFSPIGDEQTFQETLAAGSHEVTLRCADGNGGEARDNVTVVVTPKGTGPTGDNTLLIVGAVAGIAAAAVVGMLVMRRGKKPKSPAP